MELVQNKLALDGDHQLLVRKVEQRIAREEFGANAGRSQTLIGPGFMCSEEILDRAIDRVLQGG